MREMKKFFIVMICGLGLLEAEVVSEYGVNRFIVDSTLNHVAIVAEKTRASDTSITLGNYTLTISSTGNIASLQMPQSEYDNWNKADSGFNNTTQRNAVSKTLYTFFKDDFDFIFFINNEETKDTALNYYGQLIQTKNDIAGIGLKPFDYTSSAGSAGKLQSTIHLPYLGAIESGPTLHELMHNWANFIKSFEMASPGGNYPSIPHWGWASTEGQLGGFKLSTLQDLGGGLYQANNGLPGSTSFGGFANGGNGLAYGPWEMYLAGFWPLDSLEDITYFEGITTDATLYAEGKFNATTQLVYTKAQLIADKGARVPDYQSSQKSFRLLPVVLTPTPLTPTQWEDATAQVTWFTNPGADASSLYNFWEATRGIATISSDNLPNSLLGVSSITAQSFTSQKALSIQYHNNQISFSRPVQGYRLMKANGSIVQQAENNTFRSVSLGSSVGKGVYLMTVKVDGIWQGVPSLTVR